MTLTMEELHRMAEDQQQEDPTVTVEDQWLVLQELKPKEVCEHKTIFTKARTLLITVN